MDTFKKQILEKYKSGYASSPGKLDEPDLQVLIESPECVWCDTSIFDLDDFPEIVKGEVYCEQCHRENYMSVCPLCEDYFENREGVENHQFFLSKFDIKNANLRDIKSGIYQVKEYPFYRANCVTGFEYFFDEAIELVKELDKDVRGCDAICEDCFKKYTTEKES